MGYTTRRRRRINLRPVSKNAATLMVLRGIDPADIPGEGKITLPMVEEYLRSLEAGQTNDLQTQKPIIDGSQNQIEGDPEEVRPQTED